MNEPESESGSKPESGSATPEPATIVTKSAEPATIVTAPEPADESILPEAYSENALRDAVGAPSPERARLDDDDHHDDDEPAHRPRNRRAIAISALAIFVGLSIAVLVFLGRANTERYLLVCATDHIGAEQGRAFPPWGSHPIAGVQWKPIALPGNAECKPRETDDVDELAHWYLDQLVDRASTALTARNLLDTVPAAGANAINPIDVAADQLAQALLLARAPERRDQRQDIERLLGDVQYWRATLRLRDASAALLDAAKQFDTAAAQKPRHVSDASAWATFLRKVADELHAGPGGAPAAFPPLPSGPPSTALPGIALPIEPPPPTSSGSAAPPPAPDAGVPSGGVLL